MPRIDRPAFAVFLLALVFATDGFAQSAPRRRAVRHPGAAAPPAPVAADDTLAASQDTLLNVAAPGVLVNDTLNGATIASFGASTGTEQATLGAATPTAQGGSVVLNATGAFTYTPRSGFNGADTFRYVLRNTGGSSTATVTINVQAKTTTPDFVVESPGFFYTFSGVSGQNPVITLTRGRTYVFQIDTDASHPFEIRDAPPGSVTNNNISNGILTFAVPAAARNYSYRCSIHIFGNTIQTVP